MLGLKSKTNQSKTFFTNLFHTKTKYNYDWYLISLIVMLVTIGLAFLASSLSPQAFIIYQSEWLKQFFFGGWIGGGLCLFIARTDYHYWFQKSRLLLWVTVGSLLFLFCFVAFSFVTHISLTTILKAVNFSPIKPYFANGALRWISISFLPNFQPAELAKLSLLIYLGSFVQKFSNQKESITWSNLKRPLWIIAGTFLLILVQPDLGSVIIASVILGSGLIVARVPFKIIGTLSVFMVITSLFFISLYSYRAQRVSTFLDFFNSSSAACTNDQASNQNFQVCQTRQAIISGGLYGKGYGNSSAKQDNLIPEITTDAILAVIGEETGFIGTLGLMIIYFLIFMRGMRAAKLAPDLGGRVLATGISVWIVAQAFINIAGITGLIPLKGTALPFISSGGTALVLNLIACGVLFNVSSQAKVTSKNKFAQISQAFPRSGFSIHKKHA